MTYLEIINRVMIRLREDTVTALNEDYSRLIAEFVAEGHEEVLGAHDWSRFDTEVSIDLVAATKDYELTGTTSESVLRRNESGPMVYIYDDVSDRYGEPVQELHYVELDRMYKQDTQLDIEDPTWFSLRESATNEGYTASFYPLPNTARVVKMNFWTPEAVFDPDSSSLTTEMLAPWRPVYLYALMLALNERGEEIGEPGNLAEQNYYKALGKAIERDKGLRGKNDEYEFRRD